MNDMEFEFETGGDISTGGGYLKEPGTYHFIITAIDTQPARRDGTPLENAEFEITASVCDGTDKAQVDKQWTNTFYASKPGDSDEQVARNKKEHDRFWVATSMIDTEKAQTKGTKVKISLQDLIGRQFVAKLAKKKNNDYLTAWSDYYHVDDPAVSGFPRSQPHLDSIPSSQRYIGERAKSLTNNVPPARQESQKQELSDDELAGL